MIRAHIRHKQATAGLSGLAAAVLWFVTALAAFGAAAPDSVPAGMDETEYDRLRRPAAWSSLPEFISPEVLAGLSADVRAALQRDYAERGRIQVQSDRYLDYDEERNIIYSNARTRIRFDRYLLEADRVLVQVPLQEIQAEGNVILTAWQDVDLQYKSSEIHAKSMVFNYKYFQGIANEVRGQHDVVYFKCATPKSGLPPLEMVGRDEIVLRDAQFTTDDFPDPQYSVQTPDAVLIVGERIFMRNAVLRVRKIPVFFLPVYTKSLREKFPWHVTFGAGSRLGPYVRVQYNFWHYQYEPSFENPDRLETRSLGHATAKLDLFGSRGVGTGLDYRYSFDFEKHQGNTSLYFMPFDNYRRTTEDGGSNSRWQLFARHRSDLRDDLKLHLNADLMSDPEFYWDLIDPFEQEERGRLPERRARAALTYWKDDYIARILFDVKQRISRDRITNTAEPLDDDADYDISPNERISRRASRRDGLPSSRYGLASLRLPQLTFATNHLRLSTNSPLFYALDINFFNNLDKGLNFRSTRDDSFVLGLDIYQQISYLFKFSERYTLLAQVGAGLGILNRWDDSYHWRPQDFLRQTGTTDGNLMFGDLNDFMRRDIIYVDDNTFRIAGSNREVSLSDVSPAYFYADAQLRFQGRFTDSLTGNINYILREGTKNSLAEFYESIGNRTARDDLYNYRVRKHWITGDLTYRLAYPDIMVRALAGRNLQSKSDIYSGEQIHYAGIVSSYRNQPRTFRLSGAIMYEQRQMRDPGDPFEYQRDSLITRLSAAYAPIGRRWWIEGDLLLLEPLTNDPAGDTVESLSSRRLNRDLFYFFSENESERILDVWVGRKISEKWTAELGTEYHSRYGGLRDVRLLLTRDLHNALAQFQIRYRRTPYKEVPTQLQFNFSLTFKLPGPMDTVKAPRARVLMNEQRLIELAEDPLFVTERESRPQPTARPVSAL
ncbi:MAG: hypothetical protein N3D11_02120 [Candidatus Sumerlaeia bacterium]|nr:hypothetical protein [Candidatus Sumerlaeia bacterium]